VKPGVGGLLSHEHIHKEFLSVKTNVRQLFQSGPFSSYPSWTTNMWKSLSFRLHHKLYQRNSWSKEILCR